MEITPIQHASYYQLFVAKPFHGFYMTAFLRDMGRRYRVALVGTLLVLGSNFDLKS